MSKYSLSDLQELAGELIFMYAERNLLFKRMDDMFYSRWQLPVGIPEWVLRVVSTDPHDAVLTAVRTFSTLLPHFRIMPQLPDEANRKRANEIETALQYIFHQAGRRNDASVTWDVMFSATQYAEVAAQAIYLPYQEKVLDAMGKDTRRLKAAKRYGDFAFIVHNPANIYPEWSEYGLEGVLTVRVQTVDEFKDSWGKLANPIVDEDDYNEGRITYVTSFDHIDYEKRCVWAVWNDTSNMVIEGNGIKILEEENELGFIPFAIRRWGNSLSSEPKERVMPLLQSVWDSGQWDMLNLFDSLDSSLTIKRAAKPEYAGEFPKGTTPEVDNTEPAGVLELPQGTRNFTPLQAQSVDSRLAQQKADFKGRIWQSTVARTLQSLEFPSGTAYSSVNQILSTAAKSLSFYQKLSQHTLSELAHQILCWTKYYGKKYGAVDLYGRYSDKSRNGREIRISSDTIDPDILQIECELTADMPVDRLQQINASVLLYQNFRIPQEEVLEELGYNDPRLLAERRDLEDYEKVYIQTDQQKIQQAAQLEFQQAQMQMQMQAQQEQMAAQQEQQAQAMEQQQAAAAQGAMPGNENLGGQGFNPAMGGTPPVAAARGNGAG